MSELSHYYNEVACNPSVWSDSDPAKCGCRGGGWFLSEVDTWHRCPAHGKGVAHPEDAGYEDEDEPEGDVPEPVAPTPIPDWATLNTVSEDDDLPF